jgi:hypothetical protein
MVSSLVYKRLGISTTMRRKTYGFGEMRVGGSIRLPLTAAASVRQAAHNYGKRHGWRFTVRVVTTGGRRMLHVRRIR